MESSREGIRIVENSDGYVDSFGPRFVAEANAAAAVGTKASPAPITGIISSYVAVPFDLATLEGRKRRNGGTNSPSAHVTVTVRDAARRDRGFESDGTA